MGSITSHQCNEMHSFYTLCQQDVNFAVSNITTAELAGSLYKSDYCTDVKAKSVSQYSTVTSDSVPKFSCFASYGNVSYKYVCDGVSDCFMGEDEKVCTFEYEMNGAKECVQGNFICRHPQLFGLICIPKDKVCNLIQDCPDGSDESDCDSCTQVYRDPKIPNSLCNSDKPRLSNCDSLIGDMAKRILIWVIATVAIVGNIASLTYSLFFDRTKLIKVNFALFVACLNISDLLMGVYLILIASMDIKYRGEYIYHEMSWRQSPLCQLAGILATMSSETSTVFIVLITVERFISVKYPHGEYRISSMIRYISIGLCFGLGLLLSVIPVMYPSMTLYSNSGMCLGFPLRKSSGPLWAFSVAVFVFFNSVLLFLIACGQFLIYRMILKHNARRSSTVRSTNVSLASRLILVALSNIACFLPVSVIGILVLVSDYEVEENTYGWIVTLALPVNSALNPILYTAPRIYASWTVRRHRRT
ncbi:G-protein coupled receptor GRL101 [Biomphalaria pfeifferi]|uniref:G-protein coupled receptor GRL101 n=1 Tax=Biomphalaria pfeifferi TaxID=112525 RepID=A0AAD8BAN4_BIOPF|nr:G-protein coupled receptor GRL101 [Biomphalaria pfeifferi]